MKPDITNIDDIKQLVDSFYNKVNKDHRLGHIFNKVALVNWEEHLPKMYSFWETVLLGKISFKGNPMEKHIQLNKKENLNADDFERWLQLWYQSIDELFSGTLADLAKKKAATMQTLIFAKIAGNSL